MNNDRQDTTQKLKIDQSDFTKNRGWTYVLQNGKQLLIH
jgi:hypothetical protein